MISNNFAILLAKNLLKITTVSKETGISRTTLTNLYYRRSKAISFETLDTLCKYLECEIKDIFEYVKYEERGENNE